MVFAIDYCGPITLPYHYCTSSSLTLFVLFRDFIRRSMISNVVLEKKKPNRPPAQRSVTFSNLSNSCSNHKQDMLMMTMVMSEA